MIKEKPHNLYYYATKELSQDAFIAWLSRWACESRKEINPVLHETAQKFIEKLLSLHGVALPQGIQKILSDCQVKRADILIEVNDTHALMIEDKIHASEHRNQLYNTRKAIEAHYEGKLKVLPIYFKTGDQSNLENVREKSGYAIFGRKEFLEILHFGIQRGVKSDIFMDYFYWLQDIEDDVEKYKTKPIPEWQHNQWIGFFRALEATNKFTKCGWDYVANPSGGFMGFWWGDFKIGENCTLYLQIEQKKLCFKIAVPKEMESSEKKTLQYAWSDRIIKAAGDEIKNIRAFNLRIGTWMTVASVHDDSFIAKSDETNSILDFEETVRLLKIAENVANIAIQQHNLAA